MSAENAFAAPGQPRERSATRTLRRPALALLALFAAVWLSIGAVGAYHYIHRYWLYRGFPAPVTPDGIAQGTRHHVHFYSNALHAERQYDIYLPAGYARAARAGRRFPVLYLLHAPPGRVDGVFEAGAIGVREDVMVSRREIKPMLLVLPYGKTPRFASDTEWANAKAGRYESFVLDVVRNVDHRFAAYRDRQHRGIAGLSEGGYGAVNIGLHHLRRFSVIESWSGYYAQTPTASFTGATAAQLRANSPTEYVGALAPEIRRLGLRTWLYQGTRDQIAPWRIRTFSAQLHATGALVRYGFFPGGHDWGLWRHEVPRMLRAASTWFAQPPRASLRSAGALVAVGRPDTPAQLARIRRWQLAHCRIHHLRRGERQPLHCLRDHRRRR